MDETSFCLDPTRIKVVGEKGKAAHKTTAKPAKENFSVLLGGDAAGEKLPPLIIFKGKNIWDTWLPKKNCEFPEMTYAATPNGCIRILLLIIFKKLLKCNSKRMATRPILHLGL